MNLCHILFLVRQGNVIVSTDFYIHLKLFHYLCFWSFRFFFPFLSFLCAKLYYILYKKYTLSTL